MPSTLNEALSVSTNDTIIPGTTPRLVIDVDDDVIDTTSKVRIDVIQNNSVILQILNADIEDRQVSYTFSQSETYRMKPGTIRIQIHGRTEDDLAWKTNVLEIPVGTSLTSTVI